MVQNKEEGKKCIDDVGRSQSAAEINAKKWKVVNSNKRKR